MLSTLVILVLIGAAAGYYISDYRKYKKRDEAYDREVAIEKELEDEIRRCGDETDELERLVGIYDQAEDARESHFSEYRLRDIYFFVPDIEIRKQLIAKHREAARLYIEWFTQSVAVAKASGDADNLKSAESLLADNLDEPMLFSRGEEVTGNRR
jgi:hypothetical protein